MNRKYFALEKTKQSATITIYGDICSWAWEECGDMSAQILSKQLEALGDVNQIDVYINSYGGEVAEGLAIYNALRRHKATVRTFCDGFACSIASVIFMAGDERIMNEASLLMIHNAWTWASGNAAELRKQAEDLDKITQASVEAYKAHSNLKEDEIKALMDAETWILPSEALEYGFATSVQKTEKANTSQNAKAKLFGIVRAYQEAKNEDEEPDDNPDDDEQDNPDDAPKDEPGDDSGAGDPEKDAPEEPADDDPEDDSNDDSDDDSEANKEEKAAQMWSGFFNALSKMK
jgi:ATP-dependent Clp protease protease subunit